MAIILVMNVAKKRIFERFNIFLWNTFSIAYRQQWTPKNDREQTRHDPRISNMSPFLPSQPSVGAFLIQNLEKLPQYRLVIDQVESLFL